MKHQLAGMEELKGLRVGALALYRKGAGTKRRSWFYPTGTPIVMVLILLTHLSKVRETHFLRK